MLDLTLIGPAKVKVDLAHDEAIHCGTMYEMHCSFKNILQIVFASESLK